MAQTKVIEADVSGLNFMRHYSKFLSWLTWQSVFSMTSCCLLPVFVLTYIFRCRIKPLCKRDVIRKKGGEENKRLGVGTRGNVPVEGSGGGRVPEHLF